MDSAHIKHFYRKEKVYTKCRDKSFEFYEWVETNVEHYKCSKCNGEVDKRSRHCTHCGRLFSGIEEEYKTTVCSICNSKFKQLAHEREEQCPKCIELMGNRYGADIAKIFYEYGKTKSKVRNKKLRNLPEELQKRIKQMEADFENMTETESGYYAALLDIMDLIKEA